MQIRHPQFDIAFFFKPGTLLKSRVAISDSPLTDRMVMVEFCWLLLGIPKVYMQLQVKKKPLKNINFTESLSKVLLSTAERYLSLPPEAWDQFYG